MRKLSLEYFIQLPFDDCCRTVQAMPYQRNAFKADILCVLKENCGTCSTKHAFLKYVAEIKRIDGVQLMLGIFMMNSANTPRIIPVLQKYNLQEMPEAHNYLKINGEIKDFTRKGWKPEIFANDLVFETEIETDQITDFKIDFHRKFLSSYLKKNTHIIYSLEEFWKIREECIKALQK